MAGTELGYFGDQRLRKRGGEILERMRLRGTSSLRQLADTAAEMRAYERFFGNQNVTVDEIIGTATRRTAEAAIGRDVLLIQDSSEINFESKSRRKRHLGTVGNGTDAGLFVHPALVVDAADGMVLGLGAADIWRRFAGKDPAYQEKPIEDKESFRWISTAHEGCQVLAQAASVTVVADRECDIYEFLARVPNERAHVVVRAAQDRVLATGGRLWGELASQSEAGRTRIELPARPGRAKQMVELAVRFTAVTLRQPATGADPRDPKTLTVWAVDIAEIDPPGDRDLIHWRLLTTHRVDDLAGALRIVEIYRFRWLIEQLFRTTKSEAIDIESSLIEDGESLECFAATALIAAVSVLQLVQGRDEAGRSASASRIFDDLHLQILPAVVRKFEGKTAKQRNPHPPASLAWAAWAIARLGGWKGYATGRPPGPITFSRGLARFQGIVEGFAMKLELS